MEEARRRVSITPGMSHVRGGVPKYKCKDCGLVVYQYRGRYPAKCSDCGGELEAVGSEEKEMGKKTNEVWSVMPRLEVQVWCDSREEAQEVYKVLERDPPGDTAVHKPEGNLVKVGMALVPSDRIKGDELSNRVKDILGAAGITLKDNAIRTADRVDEKKLSEGLEKHVQRYMWDEFKVDVDVVSDGKRVRVELGDDAGQVGEPDMKMMANALAKDVITKYATVEVWQDWDGVVTSGPVRGKTPLYRESAGEKKLSEGKPEVVHNKKSGPGKFEGEGYIGEWIYGQVMDGTDEELGDVQGFGWYGLLLFRDGVLVIEPDGKDWTFRGAIVTEDNQGFFYVDYFDTERDANKAWDKIEDAYDDWMEDVEESTNGAESVQEKATTATTKCPVCGTKVLVATGYCVKCKKKTIKKKPKEKDKKKKEGTTVATEILSKRYSKPKDETTTEDADRRKLMDTLVDVIDDLSDSYGLAFHALGMRKAGKTILRVIDELQDVLKGVKVPRARGESTGRKDEQDDDDPSEGDYVITPAGQLGSQTAASEVGGRWAEMFDSDEEALAAIEKRMEKERFWPNVWFISDHGNVSLMTKTRRGEWEFAESSKNERRPKRRSRTRTVSTGYTPEEAIDVMVSAVALTDYEALTVRKDLEDAAMGGTVDAGDIEMAMTGIGLTMDDVQEVLDWLGESKERDATHKDERAERYHVADLQAALEELDLHPADFENLLDRFRTAARRGMVTRRDIESAIDISRIPALTADDILDWLDESARPRGDSKDEQDIVIPGNVHPRPGAEPGEDYQQVVLRGDDAYGMMRWAKSQVNLFQDPRTGWEGEKMVLHLIVHKDDVEKLKKRAKATGMYV